MINWVFDKPEEFLNMTRCPNTVVKDNVLLSGRFPAPNLVWYWTEADRWASGRDVQTSVYSVDRRPDHYIYNIGTWTDPTVWAGLENNKFDYQNLFEYVPQEVLEDARNGRAILAVDNLAEGFYNPQLYEFWHTSCSHYNIPPKSIVYLTSNELDKRGYHEWARQHGITDLIHVVAFCHFEYQFQKFAVDFLEFKWEQHIERKIELGRRVKTFNCLNRINRDHRTYFMIKLIESGLYKHGIVSHDKVDLEWWRGWYEPLETLDKMESLLPLVADDPDFNNNKSIQFAPDIYLNSWVSVITETHAEDELHNFFISEKTWKPIFAMQPFMILGHKGTLARLREMGYKTFDGLIDESYDQREFYPRSNAIINNLQFLHILKDKPQWFADCKDICEHNQRVFLAKDFFESQAASDIIAIYNTISQKRTS